MNIVDHIVDVIYLYYGIQLSISIWTIWKVSVLNALSSVIMKSHDFEIWHIFLTILYELFMFIMALNFQSQSGRFGKSPCWIPGYCYSEGSWYDKIRIRIKIKIKIMVKVKIKNKVKIKIKVIFLINCQK